jgi:hypothetical protein
LTRLAEVSAEVVLLVARTDNIKTTKEKSKTMMNLTKEEIVALADRLDDKKPTRQTITQYTMYTCKDLTLTLMKTTQTKIYKKLNTN